MRAPRLKDVPPTTTALAKRRRPSEALRALALGGVQAAGFDCHTDVGFHRMRLFDVDVCCLIRLDAAEIARRAEVGLDPITDYGALRLLASLPLGHPVPLLELPDYESRLARTLAGLAVTITDAHVVRQARPPLSVVIAAVVDGDWRRGFKTAGRFSNFASRMLVYTGGAFPDDAVAEATFYGVGLAGVGDDGAIAMTVSPEPHVAPLDPVVWQFQEEVLEQIPIADDRCVS